MSRTSVSSRIQISQASPVRHPGGSSISAKAILHAALKLVRTPPRSPKRSGRWKRASEKYKLYSVFCINKCFAMASLPSHHFLRAWFPAAWCAWFRKFLLWFRKFFLKGISQAFPGNYSIASRLQWLCLDLKSCPINEMFRELQNFITRRLRKRFPKHLFDVAPATSSNCN